MSNRGEMPDDCEQVPKERLEVTGAADSGESEVSYPARIRQLVPEIPESSVFRHVGLDGTEATFTWPELDRPSSQLAGALADRGLGLGDRLAIALPNSPQLVLSAMAAWKLGATPVPLRWDLPDWERQRLRDVVDARVNLDEASVDWIDRTANADPPDLPDVVSPSMNGICSSGSSTSAYRCPRPPRTHRTAAS